MQLRLLTQPQHPMHRCQHVSFVPTAPRYERRRRSPSYDRHERRRRSLSRGGRSASPRRSKRSLSPVRSAVLGDTAVTCTEAQITAKAACPRFTAAVTPIHALCSLQGPLRPACGEHCCLWRLTQCLQGLCLVVKRDHCCAAARTEFAAAASIVAWLGATSCALLHFVAAAAAVPAQPHPICLLPACRARRDRSSRRSDTPPRRSPSPADDRFSPEKSRERSIDP